MSQARANITWSPSRRTLVKGAAWTAPAVVVATTAAPAFAATRPPVAPPPESQGCKYPGNSRPWEKSYRVAITFSNGTNDPVDVSITGLTWRGANPTFPGSGGSTSDLFFDPRFCEPDGNDPDTVADSCTPAGNPFPFNFSIGAGGSKTFWVFLRGDASSQNDLCFTYTYDNGFGSPVQASACTTIHFDPTQDDCGCTTPQPPYTPDTGKTC